MTPREQLARIAQKAAPMVERHARTFVEVVMPQLAEHGVRVLRWDELKAGQRARLDELFTESIFPVLTPLAVDPGRPFPYISNLSLNLAVMVHDPTPSTPSHAGAPRYARRKPILRACRDRAESASSAERSGPSAGSTEVPPQR